MEDRDIDIEIQKYEKKILTNKISEQEKEIARLQARVNELSAKLQQIISSPGKTSKVSL